MSVILVWLALVAFVLVTTYIAVYALGQVSYRWQHAAPVGRRLAVVCVTVATFGTLSAAYSEGSWLRLLDLLFIPIWVVLILYLVSWFHRRWSSKRAGQS